MVKRSCVPTNVWKRFLLKITPVYKVIKTEKYNKQANSASKGKCRLQKSDLHTGCSTTTPKILKGT